MGISIPTSLIEKFSPLTIPFGDAWKQLVWLNRNDLSRGEGGLANMQRRPIMEAPISKGGERGGVSGLVDWKEVDERGNVLCDGEEMAMQWIFQREKLLDELVEDEGVEMGVVDELDVL
jgi:hypothetical protein